MLKVNLFFFIFLFHDFRVTNNGNDKYILGQYLFNLLTFAIFTSN